MAKVMYMTPSLPSAYLWYLSNRKWEQWQQNTLLMRVSSHVCMQSALEKELTSQVVPIDPGLWLSQKGGNALMSLYGQAYMPNVCIHIIENIFLAGTPYVQKHIFQFSIALRLPSN